VESFTGALRWFEEESQRNAERLLEEYAKKAPMRGVSRGRRRTRVLGGYSKTKTGWKNEVKEVEKAIEMDPKNKMAQEA